MRAIGGFDNPSWRRGAAVGCALLLLVPLVCAAGVASATPAHQAGSSAAVAAHHGAAMGTSHHAQPHWAAAGHADVVHHGHECCAVVARKPGREDTPRLSAPAASSPLATPVATTPAAPVRHRQSRATTSGPPDPAAILVPLRL